MLAGRSHPIDWLTLLPHHTIQMTTAAAHAQVRVGAAALRDGLLGPAPPLPGLGTPARAAPQVRAYVVGNQLGDSALNASIVL